MAEPVIELQRAQYATRDARTFVHENLIDVAIDQSIRLSVHTLVNRQESLDALGSSLDLFCLHVMLHSSPKDVLRTPEGHYVRGSAHVCFLARLRQARLRSASDAYLRGRPGGRGGLSSFWASPAFACLRGRPTFLPVRGRIFGPFSME